VETLKLIIDSLTSKDDNSNTVILNDISTLVSRLNLIDKENKNILYSSGLIGNKLSNLIDNLNK
jgi:hypothetical protein